MLLRSAPQPAFEICDADETDQHLQPPLRAEKRPRIVRVREPSFERASRVFAGVPPPSPGGPSLPPRPRPTAPLLRPLSQRVPPCPPRRPEEEEELFCEDEHDEAGASSIAPMALDVGEPPPLRPSFESLASMAEIERAAGIPQKSLWQTALLLVGSCALAALCVVSVVGLRRPPPDRALIVTTPRAPSLLVAHEAVFVPVVTAPAKESSAAPTFHRAAMSSASRSALGVLRLASSVKGVLVDGAPHKVERGVVSLPCGTHRVKTAAVPSRVVVVACSGPAAP